MVIEFVIWIMFGITIAYILVIGTFIYGWKTYHENDQIHINHDILVSLVVAVRNESENIRNLIDCLLTQTYESNKVEIIFVDDNSEDDTWSIIDEEIKKGANNIRLIKSDSSGKKGAIRQGVLVANNDLILTTDGDCSMGPNWISSIVDYYKNNNKNVVLGPVTYNRSSKVISKLFTIEFASLVASGAGSAMTGLPLMGNGANLAFEKKLFDDYDDRSDISASGDDVFLIHHSAVKYGYKSVGFVKNEDAIVNTSAPNTLREFFNQRIRWASKAGGYNLFWPILVSSVVFIFNLQISAIFVMSYFYLWLLPVFALLVITKFMIDFPLVVGYLNFSGHRKLKYLFPFLEIIYPFYISTVSIASFFGNFGWKGRKY